ncbi:MAG: helix-turn-helix transcriptional regulator [Ignavibacteria bacterium]|nr:helix-turn-helix transcriptional regulator [Ignavibacteria bacterium]
MRELEDEFLRLLESQQIRVEDLDYSLLDAQRALLNQLAEATNSGITVFDHSTQRHVFSSDNCRRLFGSDTQDSRNIAGQHFHAQVHPEDLEQLTRNGIAALHYFIRGEGRDLLHTKMISEYRILVAGQYVRVIEQFKVLNLDAAGNVWLSLSTLDVSPNQGALHHVHSKLFNSNSGEVYMLPEFAPPLREAVALTARELDVLQRVHAGKLSKEIAGECGISIHTVNTHRQSILRKLNANNMAEAVLLATRLGLLQ